MVQKQELPGVTGRHYGVDALRIVSMFLVLVLHIMGFGGVLSATQHNSLTYIAAWVLETIAFCSVNCYAMISGYVGVQAKYRYTNLVMLWLQVALYSVGITLIFLLVKPDSVGIGRCIKACMPVYSNDYWYFSAYCGLFFFIPGLNLVMNHLNRRQAKVLCFGIIVLFSVLPTALKSDVFSAHNGYSMVWLMLMYILGACIRKHGFLTQTKNRTLIIVCVVSVLIAAGMTVVLRSHKIPFLNKLMETSAPVRFTSPAIVAFSVSLLLLFLKRPRFGPVMTKLIAWFSPLAFGVYLIHLHQLLYQELFLTGHFKGFADLPAPLMVLAVLGSAVVIFVACALIDKLRLIVFEKLRLRQRVQKLEDKYIGDLWHSDAGSK